MGYFCGLDRTKSPLFEPKIASLGIDRSADFAGYWVAGASTRFGSGAHQSSGRGEVLGTGDVSGAVFMLPEPPKRALRASIGEIPGTRNRAERRGRSSRRPNVELSSNRKTGLSYS